MNEATELIKLNPIKTAGACTNLHLFEHCVYHLNWINWIANLPLRLLESNGEARRMAYGDHFAYSIGSIACPVDLRVLKLRLLIQDS